MKAPDALHARHLLRRSGLFMGGIGPTFGHWRRLLTAAWKRLPRPHRSPLCARAGQSPNIRRLHSRAMMPPCPCQPARKKNLSCRDARLRRAWSPDLPFWLSLLALDCDQRRPVAGWRTPVRLAAGAARICGPTGNRLKNMP